MVSWSGPTAESIPPPPSPLRHLALRLNWLGLSELGVLAAVLYVLTLTLKLCLSSKDFPPKTCSSLCPGASPQSSHVPFKESCWDVDPFCRAWKNCHGS